MHGRRVCEIPQGMPFDNPLAWDFAHQTQHGGQNADEGWKQPQLLGGVSHTLQASM